MRALCIACKKKYRVKKNSVQVIETFGEDSDKPYKLWEADLWECPGCGHQMVSGFGQRNWAEHFQPNFEKQLEFAQGSQYCFWDKSC